MWQTVIRWGDPMWSEGEEFNNFSRGNANSQKLSFGDNNDGMHLFNHNGHNILVAVSYTHLTLPTILLV